MDKFFYRLVIQTGIKGVITPVISLFTSCLLYTMFASILQPISATFDFWLQFGLGVAITVVTCFMLISVKDSFYSIDVDVHAVGRFWSRRVYNNKKVRWIYMETVMLPLLAAAAILAYLTYTEYPVVLEEYRAFYAADDVDATEAMYLFISKVGFFVKPVLAIFLFAQWKHVRGFAKQGRCPACHAAFSLGYHNNVDVSTTYSSKIKEKAKTRIVGGKYEVTMEDGREVDRTRVGNIYETTYDKYKVDTKTVFDTSAYCCGFCRRIAHKTDVHTTFTTTKL